MTEPDGPVIDSLRHPLPSELLHDLRTPLNQIIGYTEMLMEQAEEAGQDSFAPHLAKVRAAGYRLLALMDDNLCSMDQRGVPGDDAGPGEANAPEQEELDDGTLESAVGESASAAAHALVLVVDDVEADRYLLSRRLKRQGYAVATAKTGRQALKMLRGGRFELVLLDLMMPTMDGYEVLERIKADESLRHTSVIVTSSLNQLDAVARCIEIGAEDYIAKPFNSTLFNARLASWLERKQARDRETALLRQLQAHHAKGEELEKSRGR